MSTIESPNAVPAFDGPTHHVVLDGVERGSWWRRWGHLPAVGTGVDLVPSLHLDRLNVVDDATLELIGSVPRSLCPAFASGPTGRGGVVVSATASPRPVIVIAVPGPPDPLFAA